MTNLIDRYLLFRVRTKQDPEAFARLYDRYVEAMYRFAILKVPTVEDAQDVTAETFTRAWQYMQHHPNVVNPRALLYRISRNLIADLYRRSQPTVSLDAVTFDADSASTLVTGMSGRDSDHGREHRIIEARVDLTLLFSKLKRLKENYRDVLMLRLIDDLPFSLIAEILEKKTGTVRVIYLRAMKALSELETEKPTS